MNNKLYWEFDNIRDINNSFRLKTFLQSLIPKTYEERLQISAQYMAEEYNEIIWIEDGVHCC